MATKKTTPRPLTLTELDGRINYSAELIHTLFDRVEKLEKQYKEAQGDSLECANGWLGVKTRVEKLEKGCSELANEILSGRLTQHSNTLTKENATLGSRAEKLGAEIIRVREDNERLYKANERLKDEVKHLKEDNPKQSTVRSAHDIIYEAMMRADKPEIIIDHAVHALADHKKGNANAIELLGILMRVLLEKGWVSKEGTNTTSAMSNPEVIKICKGYAELHKENERLKAKLNAIQQACKG
jgi:predicted DNA-binding transcriptional regulator